VRIVALAQRLKDDVLFIHLIQASKQLTGDLLKLLFLFNGKRRPELVQAVMLRGQHLT